MDRKKKMEEGGDGQGKGCEMGEMRDGKDGRVEGNSDRFVVELLEDGVEEARGRAIGGHGGAAAEGCHFVLV